jgi:hypothetical protein
MLNITTTLIIAGVCIVIGLVAGIFLALIFNRGSDTRHQAEKTNGAYDQIMVLLRDRRDASLLAEIDGRLFASSEPLNDGQHETLEKSARELYAWLRLPPEPEVQAPIRSAAAPARTTPLPEVSRPAARPEGLRFAAAIPLAAAAEKARPVPPQSIVEQIDDILQDMVNGTPLAEKSIRLVDDPIRGVIVWIGLEHFEGINAVPDIEARTIIQAAVREWEKKAEIKI